MALATKRTNIGTHLWLARYASLTSDASNKPAADDAAWIKLGITTDGIEWDPAEEAVEIFEPQPTVLVRSERLITQRGLTASFTVNEFSAFAVEALFGSQALTAASTQFNPQRGNALGVLGWLKYQGYDKSASAIITQDVWCQLSISSPVRMASGEVFQAAITAYTLHSTLNTAAV